MECKRQALAALSFYHQRSLEALDKLDQGDWDAVTALLMKKTAAFHNFKAADVLLLQQGIDVKNELEVVELLGKILEIDKVLTTKLSEMRGRLNAKLNTHKRLGSKIFNYGSGSQSDNEIELKV